MLDVIIVNYRTPALTVDCLRSMEAEVRELGQVRVWIVENGSGDDSTAQIAAAIDAHGWQPWAHLKISERNLGFAGGNNLAIRETLQQKEPASQYILLLNPDTVVRPGALTALLRFMQEHPDVGIAGSRLEDADGQIARSAFRFPTWISELEEAIRIALISRWLQRWIVAPPPRPIAHATDWVCGASMIARRQVFDAIGILDEQYFMYFEELDFCLRARQAGWPCWYVPESRVVHLTGQSSGMTVKNPRRRPTYWFAARRHFFLKHHGHFQTLLADLCWAGAYAVHRTLIRLWGRKCTDPPWLWWDFVKYNFGIARLFGGR